MRSNVLKMLGVKTTVKVVAPRHRAAAGRAKTMIGKLHFCRFHEWSGDVLFVNHGVNNISWQMHI
jgi:hypothetical protein